MEEQLTTAQVAQILGVSDQTIRRWIANGSMPGYRITDESWYRVDRRELERFAKERNLPVDWSVIGK